MNIVFLSCDSLKGFVVDDNLLVKELTSQGHNITTLSWTAEAQWNQFDCCIIRTTWDYMERPQEFFKKLEIISSQTKLYNKLETVRWNIHKSYLSVFERKGVSIVPTVFFNDTEDLKLPANWNHDKVVVKPAVSAGSFKTIVMSREDVLANKYKNEIHPGDWMCQPFLPQIFDGEISLIYFNKVFSHALLKVPKAREFRVQEEFGGAIIPMTPDQTLLDLGNKVVGCVSEDLLYARVDLVPYENHYALMELELIEPALYFRISEVAAKNFAKALDYAKKQQK